MNERKQLTWEELERITRIQRNQVIAPTQKDIEILTRKKLGPAWGTKRIRRDPKQ